MLTDGETRRENYERMAEVLRRMEIRGDDLHTNLPVHYGLVQWFLGKGVMAEPNTRFMQSFLAAVGALQQISNDVDLTIAAGALLKQQPTQEAALVLSAKQTLLVRPIEKLLESSHVLAGFLGRFDGTLWERDGSGLRFLANPVHFLERLYHFLDMDEREGASPSERSGSRTTRLSSRLLPSMPKSGPAPGSPSPRSSMPSSMGTRTATCPAAMQPCGRRAKQPIAASKLAWSCC